MKKQFFVLIIGLSALSKSYSQDDGGMKMKFNGFGDVVYGQTWGPVANKTAAQMMSQYGSGEYPNGMHNGFTSHGFDMLGTVMMKHNFKFQAEINVEGSRGSDGGEFDLEVERLYVDYSVSEKFGLQVGYMFTPIGYINRNLYSRAWLMNSIRFYQAIEPGAGFIPNHFMGATAYGKFVLPDGGALNYMVGYGKARDIATRDENVNNDEPGYQSDGLLELQMAGEADFRIGLSGFCDEIHTYNVSDYGQLVDIGDSDASKIVLHETGFNPYILYKGKLFDFLAEYDYVAMKVVQGEFNTETSSPRMTYLNALSSELAINCKIGGKRFAPYVRYDYIIVPPNMGPYYGLTKVTDDVLTKNYVPNFNALMVGIAYDVSANDRIKIEYIHHLDGPTQQNGLFLQTAFGF